ncbi:MAG: SDR family oxidoreductase [Treponemataceae bacterium]
MNILLTGASGLLGRSLIRTLSPLAADGALTGLAFSRAKAPLVSLDLTDEAAVRAAFKTHKPDLVVHAAAERRPDAVDGDPEAAEKLNVGATALLASLCSERGAKFLYVSTDYVFDGTTPPYRPDSPTNPLNAYGRMKLAGEQAVREAYANAPGDESRWAIVRIPILYGRVESLAESPVTELAAKVFAGKLFKAEDWASRYPAHADDVARAIALVCDCLSEREGGIFHFAGAQMLTKYDMARVIAAQFGFDPALVESDPQPPAGAPRPKDCRLDGSRLLSLGFAPEISFADGVREAAAPFSPKR